MPVPPRPPFSALPLDPTGPPGNAWGLYGKDDALGALNMLTPEVVAATAASEIRTGVRVPLDWQLDKPLQPSFGRERLIHTLKPTIRISPHQKEDRLTNDDTIFMNTQGGTQWDGFRHYGYQKALRFYNNTTQDDIDTTKRLGIDIWVEHGGIVGRGVLLDYADYAARHHIHLDHFTCMGVPAAHLKDLVHEQGITFQPGDILLIRMGYMDAYDALTPERAEEIGNRADPQFLGLEPGPEMLQFLWETGCAAVAGDVPALEQWPVKRQAAVAAAEGKGAVGWKGDEPWLAEMESGALLHQWLLSGWGVPIGEMWNMEAVAAECRRQKRWSFFMTSIPLRVPGGVASPPNAVAIF